MVFDQFLKRNIQDFIDDIFGPGGNQVAALNFMRLVFGGLFNFFVI